MANKLEEARRSGLAYALKIIIDAKDSGKSDAEAIEKLRQELKFRNITKAPLMVPKSEVDRFCAEVKENCIISIECLTMVTLHDEFGFGHGRLQRFGDRFSLKTECLADDYTNWEEQADILMNECKVDLHLPATFISRGNLE